MCINRTEEQEKKTKHTHTRIIFLMILECSPFSDNESKQPANNKAKYASMSTVESA